MGLAFKTCEQIFVSKNFPWREMFVVISRCRKNLVISTPNQIILCNYFEYLLVYLYDVDVFFISAINSDEYFTKFIASRFLILSLFHFYSIGSWPKVQNGRNIYTNLNTCHNCFFMLCSYQNSCFCSYKDKCKV